VVSGGTGKITQIGALGHEDDPREVLGPDYQGRNVVRLAENEFVCPGMIDTHCHAPQYRQLGSANNLPLVQQASYGR
jgi:cytosine/adenosine deaminase-related metal-dependent hydrolase